MNRHWRNHFPLAHRVERWANYWWEYVTWGPLYFVRRVICRVVGCIDAWDSSTPEGGYYCKRCHSVD